jgi:putative ABC transport system permease protein
VRRILGRKLRRDAWHQRAQFAAVIVVVAMGVTVFIGASDAYRNLKDSFARAYAAQRLPDVVLTGPNAGALFSRAAALPGDPAVTSRVQADLGARLGDHTVLARVVSLPDSGQPTVAKVAVRSGGLPGPGQVLVEQHLADHFHLAPGDRIALLAPSGWRTVTVSGSGLSAEYFWPARSQQETMTSAEQFGVVFAPRALADQLGSAPQQQLAVYARDRGHAAALVTAATALARANNLLATTRSDQPSYSALDQDVRTFGQFANLLPVLFLVAGVLGAFILLSRLVQAQRAVIGTLTANGLSPGAIRRHYLGYGVIAGIGATPLGIAAGYVIGAWFTTRYTNALGLPLHVVSLHPQTLVLGSFAGVAATSLAAWGPARAASRVAPAEAMRIVPSSTGRRLAPERVIAPLRRLPARWRMVVRGVSRNRRRAGFTIVGVAVSLSLVIVFAGLRDTVSYVLDRQYGDIDRSDGQLYANPGQAATLVSETRRDPVVAAAEPFGRVDVTLTAGPYRHDTLLWGLPASTSMHHFVTTSGRQLALSDHGELLVGAGIRRLLDVRVGDPITVTLGDGAQLREPVAGFIDEPMAAVAYISLNRLNTLVGHDLTTGALVRLRPGIDRDAASHRLGALPGAAAYLDNRAVEAAMRNAFAIMDVLVAIMLAFAVIMSAALLFNAMSANLAERAVELGTLHAAGLARAVLARIVAAENLLLTLAGIPVGLVAGTLLARWFMANYQTQGYRWALHLETTTLGIIVAGVLAASLISQLPVLRALRRIDVAQIVRQRAL